MRNLKITLGLMFSMIFLGTNVGYAIEWHTDAKIKTYITIKKASTVDTIVAHKRISYTEINNDKKEQKDRLIGDIFAGIGSVVINDRDTVMDEDNPVAATWGYAEYYDLLGGETDTVPYNRFTVKLKYKDGKDYAPVLKRTIVVGQRYEDNEDNKTWYFMKESSVVFTQYIVADSIWHKAQFEDGSGTATYIFKDKLYPLMQNTPIYSIQYEIACIDEVAGSSDDTPAGSGSVTLMRGIALDVQDGISTMPNHLSGIHYCQSNKDFTFTAISANPITVSTDRDRGDEGGVVIEDNGDDTYTVTIRRVQQNLKVTVKASGTESSNDVLAKDDVWASNGILYVNAATPGALSVYSLTGQLLQTVPVSGTFTTTLPKGLYIVQLNGKAYKVVL